MEIEQQYQELLPKLKSVLQQITTKLEKNFRQGFIIETNMKSMDSLERKCKDKNCHQINELSDLIRGRLYFPDDTDYEKVLQKLINIFGRQIKKIDWKKSRDYGLIYRGIVHIDLLINGVKFELQIIPVGFRPYIEPQHQIYEMLREGDDLDQKTKDRLVDLHNQMFDILENKYL